MEKPFPSKVINRIYYRNYDNCAYCKKEFHNSNKHQFCSRSCQGKAQRGTKKPVNISPEERTRRRKRMTGENNPIWKGGDSDKERRNAAYKNWRILVFKRDDYTCQRCGYRNGDGTKRKDLNSHHIIPWIESIELRYAIENGMTLCIPCHIKEHQPKGD